MNREIVPFAFEPEYNEGEGIPDYISDNSDQGDNQGEENVGAGRLGHTDWCECLCCIAMPTVPESSCCQGSVAVKDRLSELVADHILSNDSVCITSTERFQTLCLDMDVLRVSLLLIHNALRKGPLPTPLPNRY